MNIDIVLAVGSGALEVAAITTYNIAVWRGGTHPNRASWFLWTLIALLNAASYTVMTGDWMKSVFRLVTCRRPLLPAAFSLLKN